jgi:Uma2 family endonuclease
MSVQTASYIEAIEHLPKGATLRIPAVPWEDYEQLLADLGDEYHVRVSYNCGYLEIMSPLPEHEEFGEVVRYLAREITRELGVKLEARGSMTIRRALQSKGVEPDTCFYVQSAERIIGKRSLDFNIDPPPDIVVEIDVTIQEVSLGTVRADYVKRLAHFSGMMVGFCRKHDKMRDGTETAIALADSLRWA